jgi:hypothetical protein
MILPIIHLDKKRFTGLFRNLNRKTQLFEKFLLFMGSYFTGSHVQQQAISTALYPIQ